MRRFEIFGKGAEESAAVGRNTNGTADESDSIMLEVAAFASLLGLEPNVATRFWNAHPDWRASVDETDNYVSAGAL